MNLSITKMKKNNPKRRKSRITFVLYKYCMNAMSV